MSSKAEYFLKKTLGEDFMESLQKVELWKPGTRSTVDHEELRTALQIVPRTVMSLLIRELTPMANEETKVVSLFVPGGDATMNVTKHDKDVYSGEIIQNNKKVTEFKFRALPGIGLVIMSAFELYDMDNLINSPPQNPETPKVEEDPSSKVQRLIDERLALHDLVNKVVDKRMQEKDAINALMLRRLTDELEKKKSDIADVTKIAKDPGNAGANEYMRGMANGLEVANATVNDKEPKFVEPPKDTSPPKKRRPLEEFLEKRKKPKEFTIQMAKGESITCPDCKKNIFDGAAFSGCICLGDDMERKVFIKKSEEGIKVRFSRGWDQENIEMLLEVLRRKNG